MTSNPSESRQGTETWLMALLRIDRWPDRFWLRLHRGREVLQFATRRARDVRLMQVAGGLTFTTVLSIVPLFAVALSLFAAFPLFADYRVALEKNLLSGLLPQQYAPMLMQYLNNFTEKAGGLTAMGLVFLMFTALSMVLTVDRIFNDIWRVTERRGLVQRVLLYWCLLTLGPLVIGASLSAASWVLTASAGLTRQLPKSLLAVLELTPFLLGASALAAAYAVVPNRKVLWRDAILGALVAALLGEAMRAGFAWYIKAGTVASIYGAFAVFPLFLMWVFLSWLTILFGAAVAATAPMLRSTRFADETRAGNRFITAAAMLRALLAAQRVPGGKRDVPLAQLALAARCATDDAERMLKHLEELGYAARLGGPKHGSWTLICDPQHTDLTALFKRLAVDPDNSLVRDGAELQDWLGAGLRADWIARPLSETL